jgi:serine/threonine-protein kinase
MARVVRVGTGAPGRIAEHRLAACGLLSAALAFSGAAAAQTDVSTKAAAEGLFDQGRDSMKKGDFRNACAYLERSQQIDPAVGTLLYLAECYEKVGRTASAWATFREAASAARAIGQTDRARLGDERAERLTPLLSRLAIEVPEATRAIPGLTIRRQGQAVPTAAWDVAVPLDPGQYRIDASAPGYQDFTGTVQVADGAVTAKFSVPPLVRSQNRPESAPAPAAEPATAPPPSPQPAPVDLAPATTSGANSTRTIAYVLGGVGIVGVGVGSFFGLRAISKNDEAERECPRGRQCDTQEGVDLTDEADKAATISNVAFGLSAAALAGGLVLYLAADAEPESTSASTASVAGPRRPTIGPRVGAVLTPSALWLKGEF